jgi:hypothetical protein
MMAKWVIQVFEFENDRKPQRDASDMEIYRYPLDRQSKLAIEELHANLKADSMKASGRRVFFIMMLTGLSMTILNLILFMVIGWPSLSSNALLAYLLSFATLSGLSLVFYALFYLNSVKHRASRFVMNEQTLAALHTSNDPLDRDRPVSK